MTEIQSLAKHAVECMIKREPVLITHEVGWERPKNWPLPIKRVHNPGGPVTQPYRPMAILEYCECVLSEKPEQEEDW